MATKAEWKEAAERRLVENLALRTIVEQIDQARQDLRGIDLNLRIKALVDIAREVGK